MHTSTRVRIQFTGVKSNYIPIESPAAQNKLNGRKENLLLKTSSVRRIPKKTVSSLNVRNDQKKKHSGKMLTAGNISHHSF